MKKALNTNIDKNTYLFLKQWHIEREKPMGVIIDMAFNFLEKKEGAGDMFRSFIEENYARDGL